ncbi:MAG TPA: hypothetical protein VE993_00320 [Stellaceae bacterium]|nr:hypothetical protein [Stellaceae bacterium]
MLHALSRLAADPLATWVPAALVVLTASLGLTMAGAPPARRGARRVWAAALFVCGALAVAGTVWQAQDVRDRQWGAAALSGPGEGSALARAEPPRDRLAGAPQPAPARAIAPETAAGLAAYLKKSGSRTIVVSVIPGDPEAHDYATQLVGLLRAAGWRAEGPETTRVFGDVRALGVNLFVNPHPQQASDTARILADAFGKFGIPYEPRVTPSGVVPDDDAVELFVGALPRARIAAASPAGPVAEPHAPMRPAFIGGNGGSPPSNAGGEQ